MLVAGVDEAGRGPLAGPVVAGAVVLPEGYCNKEIQDSKILSAKKRDALYEIITQVALSWSVVAVGHHRIRLHNIRNASALAMSLAVRRIKAERVLVDGNMRIPVAIPQETIIDGDALCIQISAASILAKVWRDRLMGILDRRYPGYGLGQHFGYPTAMHRNALRKLGPSPVHRLGFNGVVTLGPDGEVSSGTGSRELVEAI